MDSIYIAVFILSRENCFKILLLIDLLSGAFGVQCLAEGHFDM